MEVLPRPDTCHAGESDCSEPISETAMDVLIKKESVLQHDRKHDCLDEKQLGTDLNFDGMALRLGDCHDVREDGSDLVTEGFPASEGCATAETFYEFDAEGQNLSSSTSDSEVDILDQGDHFSRPDFALENSYMEMDAVENGISKNNQAGSSSLSEIKVREQDKPQAVWVKWRGKWQSGIRCTRADWPLSTLKAKPTHDRKQYLVIFFPRTRNYSWADVLLVRPIDEFPQPIAYKTHRVGVKMVKDLSLAHRFIMQKLAVGMLSILDQLNREALVETARDVMVLKDFAMETSLCKEYSDLGKMLLKLQQMVLPRCLNSDWVFKSLQSWKQQCQAASSAECIEMLKEKLGHHLQNMLNLLEIIPNGSHSTSSIQLLTLLDSVAQELSDSIVWNEVNLMSNEATQVDLGSDWKSWKQEVMKCFSVSHTLTPVVGSEQPAIDNPLSLGHQTTRKRPKLEVRRADTHASGSHQSFSVGTDPAFLKGCDAVNPASFETETQNKDTLVCDNASAESPGDVADKWNDIIVETGSLNEDKAKDLELTPATIVTTKFVELGNHNRQCMAFIEAKGRQCVRYANEGEIYCCVHLASRSRENSAKVGAVPPNNSQVCGGTTVLGTKCKHRALSGSSFCKKHRMQDGKSMTSPVIRIKRKNEEDHFSPDGKSSGKIVLSGEHEIPADEDRLLGNGKGSVQESSTRQKPEYPQQVCSSNEMVHCIGSLPHGSEEACRENPKRHSLYCEKHIPNWLKRARNGKSRIVSKEVFIELLRNCHSREQKLHLHQACELFYRLFKSILSLRNPVPKEVQFQWAIAEASKDNGVGQYLMKLVADEKERLKNLWGFGDQNLQFLSTIEDLVPVLVQTSNDSDQENAIRCKLCSEKFLDDQALGKHWIDSHKKEAQWLFRGYVCAICLDSFTNKKVLESHVQQRHHVEFVEHCMLLQCIPCGSHFGNPEKLWLHVLSVHPSDLRLPSAAKQLDTNSSKKVESDKAASVEHMAPENQCVNRRYNCRFCGLKFDLLPDLGRHHQAAHMDQNSSGPRLKKKGIQFYAHKLKSGRLSRPGFKKALNSASYKIRNRSMQNLSKRIQASSSIAPQEITVQSSVPEGSSLGRLADSQCSTVAKVLASEIKKTIPRPSNSELLAIASSACCKVSLLASLEAKHGVLPKRVHLKAAKLCSEHNILVDWHRDDFICHKRCLPGLNSPILSPLMPSSENTLKARSSVPSYLMTSEWSMDESHCVIDSRHFSFDLSEKNIVLCDDISFGQEPVPIACVVDENLLNSEGPDGQMMDYSFPWESFTYGTKPLLDQSIVLESESAQLGCACTLVTCSADTCDHVYLFDNDYEDAKDIYGNPMQGRFPYDERGRIILEEGYLVYECNQRCGCSRACQNRVLQNGVQVKLEIFKTEKKGWAVRARESILRGTFVCEYIGEVIDEKEANERRNRYGEEGCKYFYEIDARINDMSRLIDGQAPYVIDSKNYGNISRYINHSCLPNLMNHQVLVESMDNQLAHIGFYASRDIATWEELTYDFRYKPLSGGGCPCLCGSSNCRGRLY